MGKQHKETASSGWLFLFEEVCVGCACIYVCVHIFNRLRFFFCNVISFKFYQSGQQFLHSCTCFLFARYKVKKQQQHKVLFWNLNGRGFYYCAVFFFNDWEIKYVYSTNGQIISITLWTWTFILGYCLHHWTGALGSKVQCNSSVIWECLRLATDISQLLEFENTHPQHTRIHTRKNGLGPNPRGSSFNVSRWVSLLCRHGVPFTASSKSTEWRLMMLPGPCPILSPADTKDFAEHQPGIPKSTSLRLRENHFSKIYMEELSTCQCICWARGFRLCNFISCVLKRQPQHHSTPACSTAD